MLLIRMLNLFLSLDFSTDKSLTTSISSLSWNFQDIILSILLLLLLETRFWLSLIFSLWSTSLAAEWCVCISLLLQQWNISCCCCCCCSNWNLKVMFLFNDFIIFFSVCVCVSIFTLMVKLFFVFCLFVELQRWTHTHTHIT